MNCLIKNNKNHKEDIEFPNEKNTIKNFPSICYD